ncbi:MAG: hypothetical protein DCC67_04120 [Planctomycetota bacterium]|nr:MAG: hypothetical protein DCC67_04120 [Planctomycetota bacterium]
MSPQVKNRIWIASLGGLILAFGIWGFGHKFVALVMLALQERMGDKDAAFAVAPVVNYLLASMGFLCLVGWAAAHGMFHDIERPKHTMLDVESELDRRSGDARYSRSVLE